LRKGSGMEKKVFVLGLPGSGKSTTARYIAMLAEDRRWHSFRISDYDILYAMFKDDTEHKFRPTEHGGFDVLNIEVFDEALQELERSVEDWINKTPSEDSLILIEFAREDYLKALKQFDSGFLNNSYFLFINVNIPTCISRIRERVLHPITPDDHFVSEYIFDAYYQKDTQQYEDSILNLCTDRTRIKVINNIDSYDCLADKVKQFVDFIFQPETYSLQAEINFQEEYTLASLTI
jgi:adenylate kinase family enzyme